MTKQPTVPDGISNSQSPTTYLILLVLFVGSGCSALIYEIVWLHLLGLVVGSTAISLGVLLGTFMGGMCLGSLLLPRLISRSAHPLRVYAALELGIGAFGLAMPMIIPYVNEIYLGGLGLALPSVLMRSITAAICLLPSTILMGATLPAIARWMESSREGVSKLGFFYGCNIAGAVAGCLLTGFYLLRVHDVLIATYVAVGLNVVVALISLGLSVRTPFQAPVLDAQKKLQVSSKRIVYVVIALSGMTALGSEVVWTRYLSLLLGANVYTFSIILSVFLVGLGIGSTVGASLSKSLRQPLVALGVCQLLLGTAILWTAYQVCESLPYWPIDPQITTSPWLTFQLDLARCAWALLPAACLWGASFPLALAAASDGQSDPGRLVGGVYAANTVGAIVGSLLFSIVAIRFMGTQQAHQILIR